MMIIHLRLAMEENARIIFVEDILNWGRIPILLETLFLL
jgi:hypothetical protein